jgi:DNA-binding transcriptional MerR regulator
MVYDNDNKNIRGKALYFSTSQVANSLNIPDSKVRYYTNVFDDILHIEVSNKQRRYTQADIDKMKFIIELKEEGMTIKQIQEYCQEVDFQNSQEIQVKETNPLSMQVIAKALLEQQAILINDMKQDIVNTVINEVNKSLDIQNEQFNDMRNSLNKDVAITVEDTINEQFQKSSDELKSEIHNRFNEMEIKIEKKDIDLVENLRETLKDDKIKSLEEEIKRLKSQPKGFLSKLFHKKE